MVKTRIQLGKEKLARWFLQNYHTKGMACGSLFCEKSILRKVYVEISCLSEESGNGVVLALEEAVSSSDLTVMHLTCHASRAGQGEKTKTWIPPDSSPFTLTSPVMI